MNISNCETLYQTPPGVLANESWLQLELAWLEKTGNMLDIQNIRFEEHQNGRFARMGLYLLWLQPDGVTYAILRPREFYILYSGKLLEDGGVCSPSVHCTLDCATDDGAIKVADHLYQRYALYHRIGDQLRLVTIRGDQ